MEKNKNSFSDTAKKMCEKSDKSKIIPAVQQVPSLDPNSQKPSLDNESALADHLGKIQISETKNENLECGNAERDTKAWDDTPNRMDGAPSLTDDSPSAMAKLLSTYRTIPERVNTPSPLEVRKSKIHGAGRGLFSLAAVKAHELVFTIPRPLVNIVADKQPFEKVCDNCFAAPGHDGTEMVYQPTTISCQGCDIVRYCSQDCRDEAWGHHHKAECIVTGLVKYASDKHPFLRGIHGGPLIQDPYVRCLIRIMEMRHGGNIKDSEWEELKSLGILRHQPTNEGKHIKWAKDLATMLTTFFIFQNLEPKEVIDMLFLVKNNLLPITLPKILVGTKWSAYLGPLLLSGYFIDPFFSLVNHSCDSNVFLYHEGRELRVRATRDISAGEELLWSYTGDIGDCRRRNLQLRGEWGFTCYCQFCVVEAKIGSTQKTDEYLRVRVLKLAAPKIDLTWAEMKEIRDGIEALIKAGWQIGTYPLRALHLKLVQGYIERGLFAEALKLCLKIYYVIEPAQISYYKTLASRIATLYLLLSLLVIDPYGLTYSIKAKALGPKSEPPVAVQTLAFQIYPHLRAKFGKDLQTCFGANSSQCIVDKKLFEKDLKYLEKNSKIYSVHDFQYIPLSESKEETEKFLKNMNEILAWAKVPAITEAQLLTA